MHLYLVHLRCRSAYLTPWRSCTLWGRFCWIVANGAIPGWNISDWLQFHRDGLPLMIIGDGLPFDAIPVPGIFLANANGPLIRPKSLPWPLWLELCRKATWPDGASNERVELGVERQHVSMNRSSGAAGQGQLRTEQGFWPSGGIIIVAWIDDALGLEGFKKIVDVFCTEGWGTGRNHGYGEIELASLQPLSRPATTGRVVTLGHCHPTDDLPQDGYWRWTGVPILAHAPDTRRAILPHRYTTMLAPGATFATDRLHLGRIIQAQLPPIQDYLHNGVVPTWPVHYQEEAYG